MIFQKIRDKLVRFITSDSGSADVSKGLALSWTSGIIAGASVLLGAMAAYASCPGDFCDNVKVCRCSWDPNQVFGRTWHYVWDPVTETCSGPYVWDCNQSLCSGGVCT